MALPFASADIGLAEDSTKEQRSISRLNGVPTVTMQIRRQSGENTVAVIEGIKQRMHNVNVQLPGDVQLQVIQDQSITSTTPSTKSRFTSSWAAFWPALSCCSSCAIGARPSLRQSRSPAL
jgi:hypothetical protein